MENRDLYNNYSNKLIQEAMENRYLYNNYSNKLIQEAGDYGEQRPLQ